MEFWRGFQPEDFERIYGYWPTGAAKPIRREALREMLNEFNAHTGWESWNQATTRLQAAERGGR